MNRQALKTTLSSLADRAIDLSLDLTDFGHTPDRIDAIASRVQRLLDEAQYQLDAARDFRETAGNMFKADQTGQQELCVRCGRCWAPVGRLLCTTCHPLPPYIPRTYTSQDRAVQQREIEAITHAVKEPHLP